MKHIILAILLLASFMAPAQTVTDTLVTVSNPTHVIITESSKGTLISLSDDSESILIEYPEGAKVSTARRTSKTIFDLPGLYGMAHYTKDNNRNGWVVSVDGLCVGLNKALDQTGGGGLQWSKSFEINWLSCLNVGYAFSRSRVYLGLGFDWRNYKATADDNWMEADGNGGVRWGSTPQDASNVRYSNLKIFSLQMPLMYVWAIPKSYLKLRVGPILNFNTSASLKGIYDDMQGNRCEYFTKDFDRRRVTLDFFGSISYHNALGLYVRYSPMKVLTSASPINFTPFSLGVTFLL